MLACERATAFWYPQLVPVLRQHWQGRLLSRCWKPSYIPYIPVRAAQYTWQLNLIKALRP